MTTSARGGSHVEVDRRIDQALRSDRPLPPERPVREAGALPSVLPSGLPSGGSRAASAHQAGSAQHPAPLAGTSARGPAGHPDAAMVPLTAAPRSAEINSTANGAAGLGLTPATATQRGSGRGYVICWAILGAASAAYLGFVAWDGGSNTERGGGRQVAQLAGDVAELRVSVSDLTQRQIETSARLVAFEQSVDTRLGGLSSAAARATDGTGALATEQDTASQKTAEAPLSVEQSPMVVRTISVPGVALVTTKSAPPSKATVGPRAEAPPTEATKSQAVAAVTEKAAPRKPTKIIAEARPDKVAAANVAAVPEPAVKADWTTVEPVKVSDAYVPPRSRQPVGAAIQTGSLASAGATASGPVGIQVGAAATLDDARQSWGAVRSRDGGTLAGLDARVSPNADGSAFRVIAGPFASINEAQRSCAALQARGITCQPSTFSGAPL